MSTRGGARWDGVLGKTACELFDLLAAGARWERRREEQPSDAPCSLSVKRPCLR